MSVTVAFYCSWEIFIASSDLLMDSVHDCVQLAIGLFQN